MKQLLCRFLFIWFLTGIISTYGPDLYAQTPVDYQSIVSEAGSTSEFPTHYAYGTLGPFTGLNRIWVFYSDGTYALWNSKEIPAGGSWEEGGIVFDIVHARYFTVAFDGDYFHIIRVVDGDLKYTRGRAKPDGSIEFGSEVTAYSDPIWKAYPVIDSILPRHFAIAVDRYKKPWVVLKVSDGNTTESNYKPIALSSIANDGTWIPRPGFPVDLASAYNARQNGRSPAVIEIDDGEVLFTWGNYRSDGHPDRGFQARLWANGTLSPIEHTGLTWHTASSSLVVPESGIAMMNSQTEVARRNPNAIWTRVDPGDMVDWSNYNSLSAYNNKVRIWDLSNGYIRYRETQNNGDTWTPIVQKWIASNILHFSASHAVGNQGNHHSTLWSEGNNPYDVVMGIEGDYIAIPGPQAPTLASPFDGAIGIPRDISLVWDESEEADNYHIQISMDPDFNDTLIDTSGVSNTQIDVVLTYGTTYYWRVSASNAFGEGDWSSIWSLTTVVDIPEIPLLVSPGNGTTDVGIDVTLYWGQSERAEVYRLQLALDELFSNVVIDNNGLVDTELSITDIENEQTYYWRVRAENEGGESEWSNIWNFTTMPALPGSPILVSPMDQSIGLSCETTDLIWRKVTRSDQYEVQVAATQEFSNPVLHDTVLTDTSFTVSDLLEKTVYYWRIRAINSAGAGAWSSVWSFETEDLSNVDYVDSGIPEKFELMQNYPNPFNPVTNIRLSVPEAGYISVVVYDMLGRQVEKLVDEYLDPGNYNLTFNASHLPSGTYIYRMTGKGFSETKRMLLIR
jgi:fibronectin type 3 domain-containing protein